MDPTPSEVLAEREEREAHRDDANRNSTTHSDAEQADSGQQPCIVALSRAKVKPRRGNSCAYACQGAHGVPEVLRAAGRELSANPLPQSLWLGSFCESSGARHGRAGSVAMRMRTTVNGRAELVTRDGTVVGSILGITVDLDLEALGVGGETSRTTSSENENSPLPSEGGQASMLADPVIETWELYVKLLERPKAVLTPKVRRWISDAHKAVGVERTNDAIRGLAASQYHRDHGYIGIEYAIRPKQSETVEGRIEMMAAKQPTLGPNGKTTVQELLSSVPSDQHWIMRDRMSEVIRAYAEGHPDTAQQAEALLRERLHAKPIVGPDGKITGWGRV